jgi:hypothetical protein
MTRHIETEARANATVAGLVRSRSDRDDVVLTITDGDICVAAWMGGGPRR